MTDIYKKSILITLVLLVTVHSEEISTTKNIENSDFLNTRLSTNLPHLLSYNDEHFTKENPKRSLHLLMSLSQDEHEPKEASRKTKRCNSFRKERFLSPLTKKNLTKTRAKNLDKNNVGISKQNSNVNSFKNVNYSQRDFTTLDRVKKTEMDEFLRAFKDSAEDESVNSESEETTKKRNTEKCICYCKEKHCFPESSKKSSSQMLGFSRKNKLERTNNRMREKCGNARPDISQQKSLRLYHGRPHETHVPDPINFFPIQSYSERVIVPHVPVLYGIEAKPYVLSHMAGNERRIPFASSHGRPNFLVGSNAHNQYQPIMYPCLTSEKNQIADPVMSATSSSVDAATVTETESDPESYDSIAITEKDEESFPTLTTETWNDYIDTSTELNSEINFYRDHFADVTTESNIVNSFNLDETKQKLKDSAETTEGSQNDNLSMLTSSLTDYVDTSSIPVTYPSITHDGKLIDMKECIKLFGRDVCVLSTTTGMLAEQTQDNDLKEYFTTPEYITQTSMKEETTLSNINYSDKHETTDAYSSLRSSVNGIEKSNANLEESNFANFESASIEPNVNVNEGDEQIYESDNDNDQNKSFSSVENTYIPSNINYSDKLETTDAYSSLRSSVSGIKKSNANLEDNFESASIEPNANINEGGEQFYESDDDNDQNKSFSSVENTHIPIKKLMDQEIPELTETAKNKLLGKSKSNKLLLILNDENTANPISGEKFPYSTTSSEFYNDGELYNLKIDQQTLITTTSANLWQNVFNEEESLQEILQEQPQEESATINHDSKIGSTFEEESTSDLSESNDNLEPTILQEQPSEKTTVNPNLKTEYNLKETKNNFVESQTDTYSEEEILREPSTTLQRFDDEKSNNLNNEEDTADNLEVAIIESSTKKLPFCDNSLLLNSIRKVINDFVSNAPLSRTKNLDENILQTQGKNLLAEILQVSNLKNILSIPRIENAIIEKVKNILSIIPKRDFTNDCSHGIIRNTLRNILENFPDFHQKLSPDDSQMTVEEHQFVNGQWSVNPVTLASILDSKVSMTNPQNLRESIRDFLSFPAIASQTDQQIVRNMIVQSMKNSLINDDEEENIDDSIIHDVLNDVLQALKYSKDTDESDKFVNNEDMTSSQKTSTGDSEIGINVGDSILNNERDLDINKDKKVDDKEIQTTYQKTEVLENNPNQLIASTPPDLLKSSEEDKNIYIEEKTPNGLIDKIEENIRDQISDEIKKINMQNDEGIKLVEPLKINTVYQKAILPNNRMLAISIEPDLAEELNEKENTKNMLLQTTTVSSVTSKNFYEIEENIVNSTPIIQDINIQNEEEIKNYPDTWNHIIVHHQPTSDLNFAKESSDELNANLNSKEDSSKYDEIEPPIIHEKNNNNKLPVNLYPSDDHTVDESVKITTPTDFMQETFPDYAKMPGGIISKNIAEGKDVKDQIEYTINEETLTTSANNLISLTNEEYGNQESNTAATVSVDTVHPLIILERIRNKESPIKYYSPEGLQYIETNPNDESVKIATSADFMQETSPDYVQMSNGVVLQNAAENKDTEREMESNGKASLTSPDNVILPTNADYENYESKITSSADKDILESQQQNFATDDNIIKIHEVTTEVQRTYAKTTYFNTQPSTDDNSRIISSSLEYETTKKANDDNNDSMDKNKNSNENINLVENNYSTTAEGNEVIASSFQPSSNNTYFLQLFPSSTASDSISELQKSQLYYINDGVKLPLEIKKLKDGSYALLIFKNICEQIMKKECPCCVPLQGRVIQESRKTHYEEDKDMIATATERQYQENVQINDHKGNNQLANSSPSTIITSMTTNKNTLIMQPEEEEESMNRFRKRNLNYNDLTTISMPVIEFAKKYNLLLDKDKMLFDEIESNDKNKNYANLSLKSAKNDETKWDKFEEEKKSMQRIGSANQERNPIPKELMISGEEIEMESKKMNWNKLADIEKGNVRVLHNKKKREHKEAEFVNDEYNIPEIEVYGKNNGRPYRYQRNTNNVTNPRAELVKSILYWVKSFFVDE